MAKETHSQDRIREFELELSQHKLELSRNTAELTEVKNVMQRMETAIAEMAARMVQLVSAQGDGAATAANNNHRTTMPQFGSFNGHGNGHYTFPTRMSHIDFPRFDGEDFRNWSFRCKQFFEVDETPDEYRIKLIRMHLEGKALQWHQSFMSKRKTNDISWMDYMAELAEIWGVVTR